MSHVIGAGALAPCGLAAPPRGLWQVRIPYLTNIPGLGRLLFISLGVRKPCAHHLERSLCQVRTLYFLILVLWYFQYSPALNKRCSSFLSENTETNKQELGHLGVLEPSVYKIFRYTALVCRQRQKEKSVKR